MDVNQPDGGILVLQNSEYPIVQQIIEKAPVQGSFSREIPGAQEEICVPSHCAYVGGTLACSAYRSIRQLEAPGRE
ncbi:MAG: hypothetical protein Q8R70_11905 [Methanoregula sp.]|nr:hypothetical protein [Methanoregula sp.]